MEHLELLAWFWLLVRLLFYWLGLLKVTYLDWVVVILYLYGLLWSSCGCLGKQNRFLFYWISDKLGFRHITLVTGYFYFFYICHNWVLIAIIISKISVFSFPNKDVFNCANVTLSLVFPSPLRKFLSLFDSCLDILFWRKLIYKYFY